MKLLNTGLSLFETSIKGALLIELTDEEELDEEDDDEDDVVFGGSFDCFPFIFTEIDLDDEPPASFSCRGWIALRIIFGDVCGL